MNKLLITLTLTILITGCENAEMRTTTQGCTATVSPESNIVVTCPDGTNLTLPPQTITITETVEVPVIIEVPTSCGHGHGHNH
jgi:hypothetical protein